MSAWYRRAIVIPSVATLIVAGAFVVNAQSNSADVNVCVGSGGILRLSEQCRTGESPLSLAGGGTSGLVGYELVTLDHLNAPTGIQFGTRSVDCPIGKKVLSGSMAPLVDNGQGPTPSTHTADNLTFRTSFPADSDSWLFGWRWDFVHGDVTVGIRFHVVCAY